jgi:hypothetical protein
MRSITRRRFLAIGALSTAVLATGGAFTLLRKRRGGGALSDNEDARRIVRAMAPVMLAGALPASAASAAALDEVVRDALAGMDGLLPHARDDLSRLFSLLAFPATRVLFAGLTRSWESASADDIGDALAGWRDSRLALKRSAYDALHSLVLGAWYGSARAWAAVGYPGPPRVG